MRRTLEMLLERYGQQLTLEKRDTGQQLSIRALLQPILKKQTHPPLAMTALGAVDQQRWLYLGSREIAIAPGDDLQLGAVRLTVQEVRDIFLGPEPLYRWAMLRAEREAAR